MSKQIVAHQDCSWQEALINAIRDPAELLRILELPADTSVASAAAASAFSLKVPLSYLSRIRKGDPNDPLLRQILPMAEESAAVEGFVSDPLEELSTNPLQGLVHKYHGRALLIVAPNCAVNCRYCFRRHFPYQSNNPGRERWSETFDYFRAHSELSEVIYSGGDPLASPDRHLSWLTQQIEAIPHIRRLRIHTRLPVVIPQRVNDELLSWMTGTRLTTSVVLHINHPAEIDSQVAAAVGRLISSGITVLNQSVLLRGINDQAETLQALSEDLFDIGVIPYYLHILDKVAGAAHFEVSSAEATAVYRELQQRLPGYLLPKLVRELPGEASKTLVKV